MITRSISGMLALLPGAAPMDADCTGPSESVGSVSFGGSLGHERERDRRRRRQPRQPLRRAVDELFAPKPRTVPARHEPVHAADGRTGGAAITMVTKSGTNVFHGSAFVFARDKALTAKDYFTKARQRGEAPFSRQQFGGSIGGPILRNRMFFFGAGRTRQRGHERAGAGPPVRRAGAARGRDRAPGRLPPGLVNPNHPRFGPTRGNLTMYQRQGRTSSSPTTTR